MVTRLVPAIYERYWRPALGRVFKGVTGPGMAEEIGSPGCCSGWARATRSSTSRAGPGNFTREFARTVGPEGLAVGIDASRTMLERGGEELRRDRARNVVLIRGDATALPVRRRELRRRSAASRPCTCSPTRSRRSTRCAAC